MEGLQSQQDSQVWECQICLNGFSWRRQAKLLACHHTCCSACLGRMVNVRHGGSHRDGSEAGTGPGSGTEQRPASQRHREQRQAALRPGTTEQQSGSEQRQPAVGGAASGQQRDGRVMAPFTQLGHSERHDELERDQRETVITPSNGGAKMEQNLPRRLTRVSGMESGQSENRTVTQLTHADPGRDQGGSTAVGPCSNMEHLGVNGVEIGLRDVMVLRHHEMDSGHHQRDALHQREPLVGHSPMEIIDTHDTGNGGAAMGQTEILSSQRQITTVTSTNQNDSTSIRYELRLMDQGETTMSNPHDDGAFQNERTNLSDIWAGLRDTRSTYQTVIVCPWCRGVTALPDGLSVNHLPDDQDKMAAVVPTAPPALSQEYMPIFIRLLPTASSYLIPWSIDRDGNQETDEVMMPGSTHYLLPVYMERDNDVRDSVVLSNTRHYLLSAGMAAYLDRDGTVGGAGEPRPATGQRHPLPGTGEVWREGGRVYFREEEGLREIRRDLEEEEKRASRLLTRVCAVIVLGLVAFLLLCIILHTVACPSKSFTVISCG